MDNSSSVVNSIPLPDGPPDVRSSNAKVSLTNSIFDQREVREAVDAETSKFKNFEDLRPIRSGEATLDYRINYAEQEILDVASINDLISSDKRLGKMSHLQNLGTNILPAIKT